MGFFKKYYGNMYDDRGEFEKSTKITVSAGVFKYKNKSYNIDLKEGSVFFKKGIIIDRYYYDYNISNSNPIKKDKKSEPIFNPELYNMMLETKVVRDLNSLVKSNLSELLTPQNIMIVVGGIAVIYYFSTGGKLW